jgi:RNA polymerase sigma factor (sigma-70 family)
LPPEPTDSISSDARRKRLAEWFRELHRPLRRFIASRRGAVLMDLDDVAQEVFLRLLRYEQGDFISDPRAYLFQIASNVASEWSMRAQRRYPHDSSWLDGLADQADVTAELELSESDSQLYNALARLPSRAREILRLHFGEGLTYNAISTRVGVTPRIVKRDIAHSYSTLRFMLAGAETHVPRSDLTIVSATSNEI